MLSIDAHSHYAGDHAKTLEWMAEADIKLLNICVAHEPGETWRKQADHYSRLAHDHPDRYAWCTSFSLPDFDDSDYAEKAIAGLKADKADGAVACKVWKNIGMDLKNPDGQYVMIDDPIFTPIFEFLTQAGLPIVMHLAEPLDCWRPLDESNTLRTYYTNNPQWHMYGRDDMPHHSDIMAARDNLVARHPKGRFVGAHLASLEYDIKELAKRFDQFPNFGVDTCGPSRIVNLGRQDRDEVREFFVKYQDRIMYGSDVGTDKPHTEMSAQELDESLKRLQDSFQIGWDYYGTDQQMTVKGWDVRGLALSDDVMEKLFYANAQNWFPGV